MDDPTKQVLIVVSTRDRRSLTGLTLDSIARNKAPWSNVVILDDASTEYDVAWLKRWGWPVERRSVSVKEGLSAKDRYEWFLQSPPQFEYLCAVDNDLAFGKDFDTKLRAMWMFLKENARLLGPMILSGYRSMTYRVVAEEAECVDVNHIGGAFHFVDRETANLIVNRLTIPDWDHFWDYHVARCFKHRFVPKRSLAQHLGIYGEGVNGLSWDMAYDFVGEGRL